MNAYTTIEESKRLLELGLDSKTSDCNWQHAPGYENYEGKITGFWDDPEWGQSGDSKDLPCWSLTALIDLIPNGVHWYLDENGLTIAEVDYYKDGKEVYVFREVYRNPVDAIIWLLEHNYIKSNKNE